MRTLDFGQSLPSSGDLFATVKKKGDSITFRIAQKPVYSGKHFTQTESGWDVTECPRINNPEENEPCDICEKYFEIMKTAKEAKEKDPKAYEDLKKQARPYNVAIQFYFPILNRDIEQFQILRTTFGIRNKLDEQFQAGVDVMKSDWILRNTGSDSPRDLYSLVRKDSAEVAKFTDKEKDEFKKAEEYDLSKISDNVSKSLGDEPTQEEKDIDEIFNLEKNDK